MRYRFNSDCGQRVHGGSGEKLHLAKADNLFIHQQLYQLAYLTDDADGMQRQMKWAEGKRSEYLLLIEAASAAAADGQMQKAEELIQRSMQVSDRLGFTETTADTKANWALTQAAVGNTSRARELATASSSLAQGRSNLVPVAEALAISGDGRGAQSIAKELGRRFPNDTLLHSVGIPSVAALMALNRKAPEQAIDALRAATPYELGVSQALFPIYVRGLAYLQARRGPESVAEFQKMVDHRGIDPTGVEHSLAKLGLGRAYVIVGDAAKARAAYQDLFALWKGCRSGPPDPEGSQSGVCEAAIEANGICQCN